MSIESMIVEVLKREGGYVNHPADRGGPTNYGITEQVARAYGFKGNMKSLPLATATEIYKSRYWTGPKFDQVAAVFPQVAHEMFDTGVNMGVVAVAKFLQRILNVLNRGAIDYPDIEADGLIGRMTIASCEALKAKRGARAGDVVRKALDSLQGARYIEIAEKNPSQEAFAYGWLSQRLGTI